MSGHTIHLCPISHDDLLLGVSRFKFSIVQNWVGNMGAAGGRCTNCNLVGARWHPCQSSSEHNIPYVPYIPTIFRLHCLKKRRIILLECRYVTRSVWLYCLSIRPEMLLARIPLAPGDMCSGTGGELYSHSPFEFIARRMTFKCQCTHPHASPPLAVHFL